MRAVVRVAVAALAVGIMAGPAWAQGGFGKGTKTKEKAGVAKKDTAGKKDPVTDAFALPKGVVLRSDQQEKYNKMKQELEPKLRDALSQVEAATGSADKDKAAKGVMTVRKEIKNKIAHIIREPDSAAIKRAQEAARAAQMNKQQNKPQNKKRR